MTTGTDYPLTLPGAHGRIAAYRQTLAECERAIATAWPYIASVAGDPDLHAWRRETAADSLEVLKKARDMIAAELAVTNP